MPSRLSQTVRAFRFAVELDRLGSKAEPAVLFERGSALWKERRGIIQNRKRWKSSGPSKAPTTPMAPGKARV